MAENPFAEFAPKPEAAANPFAEFAPPAAPAVDEQAAWEAVQSGRQRFSALPTPVQDRLVRRYAPSNAGNALAGGMLMNWADEATAGVNAALETIGLGRRYAGQSLAERYADHKAFQDAQGRTYSQDRPVTDLAAKVTGGIGSAVALPVVSAVRGATMLPQMANAGLTGLGYGAIAGAGEGNAVSERALNAGLGGILGGGIGVAAVPAARGIGNAAAYVADRFKGVPEALRPFERSAVRNVADAARQDAVTPAVVQSRFAELGPEGMLGDLGVNLRNRVVGAAVTPGEGQRIAQSAVRARAEGSSARIADDVTQALGPPRNIPETLAAITKAADDRAGPLYRQFREGPVPFTRGIEETIDILRNEPSVLNAARRMANLDNPQAAQQFFANLDDAGRVIEMRRVPNATELDYIKRALDDLARTPNRNDARIYGNLARRVRTEIDEALRGTPNEGVYRQAREIAGEGFGVRDALESGQGVFSRGLSRDQMAAEIRNMSQAERAAYATGARDSIQQLMANSATKWGDNGDTTARRLLNTPANREKLEAVVGRPRAEPLLRRIEAENTFDRLSAALGGSNTMDKAAARGSVPQPVDRLLPDAGSASAFGTLVARPVAWGANALMGGALSERNARITADIARLATASGRERDRISPALLAYLQSRGMTDQGRDGISRFTQRLLEGTRPALIDEWRGP